MEMPTRPTKFHRFSAQQKWDLLLEYDKCLDWGSKSEFCRRVQVHSGTFRDWLAAREEGRLLPPEGQSVTGEGKAWMTARDRDELKRLRSENERLKQKLEKSEAAVEILGKAAALLDAMARSAAATDPHLDEPEPGRPEWLKKPVDGTSSSE
jgi:transposase